MDCIIVTRHKALAEYMLTEGIAPPGTPASNRVWATL